MVDNLNKKFILLSLPFILSLAFSVLVLISAIFGGPGNIAMIAILIPHSLIVVNYSYLAYIVVYIFLVIRLVYVNRKSTRKLKIKYILLSLLFVLVSPGLYISLYSIRNYPTYLTLKQHVNNMNFSLINKTETAVERNPRGLDYDKSLILEIRISNLYPGEEVEYDISSIELYSENKILLGGCAGFELTSPNSSLNSYRNKINGSNGWRLDAFTLENKSIEMLQESVDYSEVTIQTTCDYFGHYTPTTVSGKVSYRLINNFMANATDDTTVEFTFPL